MRYDVHTHAFHPKIADKVVAQLYDHYHIPVTGDASLDRVVVHSAATAPAQVIPANDWALELTRTHPEVIAFGAVHPGYADWEAELDRLREAGVPGIKLHPEFQSFWLDDPALEPIIEAAQKDFVFMIHVGDRLPPDQNPSCPFKLARLADRFPRARIIAAHLGGYLHWQWVLEALEGRDLWLDTSSTLSFIDDATLDAILAAWPRERLLFGSDYPIFDPGEEIERLRTRLGWSQGEIEALVARGGELFG